ncbi:MAG: hypothetical protein SNJ76_07655, partial [Fimbriimonadaceae bacterium]
MLAQFHVAQIGHHPRILDRLRHVGKEFGHLFGRFDVELLRTELHPISFFDELAGLDAEKNVVRVVIGPTQVVGVVGRDEREIELAGDPDQRLADFPLLGQSACM